MPSGRCDCWENGCAVCFPPCGVKPKDFPFVNLKVVPTNVMTATEHKEWDARRKAKEEEESYQSFKKKHYNRLKREFFGKSTLQNRSCSPIHVRNVVSQGAQ